VRFAEFTIATANPLDHAEGIKRLFVAHGRVDCPEFFDTRHAIRCPRFVTWRDSTPLRAAMGDHGSGVRSVATPRRACAMPAGTWPRCRALATGMREHDGPLVGRPLHGTAVAATRLYEPTTA